MLIRLLKNNRSKGIALFVIIILLIGVSEILISDTAKDWSQMPVFQKILTPLRQLNYGLISAGIGISIIIGFIITRLNIVHFLLIDRSYMPLIFYFLILASFPGSIQFNPYLLIGLFLVIVLSILVQSQDKVSDPFVVFKASLILALGSLFYVKLIYFIPFIWITVSMIRPLKWRELVYPVFAFLCAALFLFTWTWLVKDDMHIFSAYLADNFAIHRKIEQYPSITWISLGYIFILTLSSSIYMISRLQARKIIIRKFYQVFFMMFIYSGILFYFIEGFQIEVLSILAIPLSYLFSSYFHRKKNHWIREVLIWLWVGLIITNYIFFK